MAIFVATALTVREEFASFTSNVSVPLSGETAPCPTVSPTVMSPAPELTPSVPTLSVSPDPMASVCASVYPFTYIAASVVVAPSAFVAPVPDVATR